MRAEIVATAGAEATRLRVELSTAVRGCARPLPASPVVAPHRVAQMSDATEARAMLSVRTRMSPPPNTHKRTHKHASEPSCGVQLKEQELADSRGEADVLAGRPPPWLP